MADSGGGEAGDSSSLSSLICQENVAFLLSDNDEEEEEEEEEDATKRLNPFLWNDSESEEEYIGTLFSRETQVSSSSSSCEIWHRSARADAVRWILSARERLSFSFTTAYLAVFYFDRFSSRRRIEEGQCWASKLLAVASLSLAAKMEETRTPSLLELDVDGCHFEAPTIQRMELLVLNTLEWRMRSVTPFPYFIFFISKLLQSNHNTEILLSRSTSLIFSSIKEMNLLEFRPSAIAAAAILASSNQRFSKKTVESKMGFISFYSSIESKNHVFSCYDLMVKLSNKEISSTKNQAFFTTSNNNSTDRSCKRRRFDYQFN